MNNFKINLLIEINILDSKSVIINLLKLKIIFTKCDEITILVQIIVRDNIRIRRVVRAERR